MGDNGPSKSKNQIDLAQTPEFELGDMRVSPAERAVVLNGERRELQPRVMQVLVALAEAKPNVVSRDRLIELCWDGRVVGDDALNRCVLGLRHLAQSFAPEPFTIETIPRVGYRLMESGPTAIERQPNEVRRGKNRKLITAILVLASLIGVALVLTRTSRSQPTRPTVIISSSANNIGSRALAQELAAKLASVEAGRAASMQLLGDDNVSSLRADLALQVALMADRAGAGATLLLRAGQGNAILWSEELRQPSNHLADLKQQAVIVAADVLRCASEGFSAGLEPRTLKTYLNGCASLTKLEGREAESLIPIFREVLKTAPDFEAAWGKLLLADTNVLAHTGAVQAKQRLKSDLAAAKQVIPTRPEALLAEIVLLPGNAFQQRVDLANRAVALNPASAEAYATRAQIFQLIGRMKDAVVDARRALQLDPISPAARNTYIQALGAAGLHDAARQELREAERLWPGASSVAATRFGFNLRYGDAMAALAYLRVEPAADWMNARSYLHARAGGAPAKVQLALEEAWQLYEQEPRAIQHLIQVFGQFDREKDLLELLLEAPERDLEYIDLTFRPAGLEFWHDPRSLLVAKRAGLLYFWSESGLWPDFCFKPDLPYDCRAETAKLSRSPLKPNIGSKRR